MPTPQPPLTARGLLLDMDGTLVNSDAVVERVWRDWALSKGVDPAAVLRIAHGRQGHLTMADVFPDRPMELNHAENEALLARETSELDGVVPVAGAHAFMAALVRVPHALVTSADTGLATARMRAAEVRIPDVCITAEHVSASKPDPEGFLKGAAELGLPPEDCVAFEDSGAGVAAARAAGMRVVGVGARAAEYDVTAHVLDLTGLTAEPLADGVRLEFRA
ncbi:HAD-IA family hydrolase [Streptomyces sp. HNM0575]|uniref:HAD-IA family hydrolase n=1 Tax=Streptomyces sp. HNM0575 TaxID=2716338 RepID=UPI00145DEE5B|nr:HAD-IA family hydrolase [Streptomyces sp. HNM0575]NLU71689.1 HAD-IA family hydrolase [Streptomyces sp. HNM0575]